MGEELKTLKDTRFPYRMIDGGTVRRKDLRAEAVRQVKAIGEIGNGVGVYFMDAVYFKLTPGLRMVREYIVWQNNLTDKDLKDV